MSNFQRILRENNAKLKHENNRLRFICIGAVVSSVILITIILITTFT